MLGRRSRVLVVLVILATAVFGALVHRIQNTHHAVGGVISLPKLAWLMHSVLVWGLVCPIIAFEPRVSRPFRILCGVFAASMWVRFAAEIPMLYLWRNWRPPYGMTHDVVTALAIVGGLAAMRSAWWPLRSRSDRWMLTFTLALVVGVLVECVFAGMFDRAVAGATTGAEALWFAAPGDPRFTVINRLTLSFDLIFYGFLVVFLTACFEPRRAPAPAMSA